MKECQDQKIWAIEAGSVHYSFIYRMYQTKFLEIPSMFNQAMRMAGHKNPQYIPGNVAMSELVLFH